MFYQARKTAKEIARLEPDIIPGEEPPPSPGSDDGKGSEIGGMIRRRTTARISIRDRFKKNLAKVITEANQSLEDHGSSSQQPDEMPGDRPPPLPRRAKFSKINRLALTPDSQPMNCTMNLVTEQGIETNTIL